jgi:hypothetical protein
MNPATTETPERKDRHAIQGLLRRNRATATTKQLTARARKPTAPAMKWVNPEVLSVVGNPSGVPMGNPSTESLIGFIGRPYG